MPTQGSNTLLLSRLSKTITTGVREIDIAGQTLKIHELGDVYDSLTGRALTGSWIWDSALLLSRWLVASQLDLRNKSVIELGAGAGLPGLTAALLGASRVLLTDIAPLLPGLVKNVEANELEDRVEVRELVWGSDESLSRIGESRGFDVVLMSDVFFDIEHMAALGRTLKMLSGSKTRVLAASEVRFWTGECLNELASQGFEVVEVPSQEGGVDGGGDIFAVYNIIPPC
ncbi:HEPATOCELLULAR CARCINOMA-ASSOCIATED ANTIGEN [Salix viminalis]|uniref:HEPATOCELLULAR CARCINOMA-ASSOCIATED ANTIGEN n=1 Tax=Salix viminalis TaxID=40686 RepID=A0A9Q0YYL9_SALVM|nr:HEPATOCELLULAR CARCINOMA-ASSOCIATED ANTIGEN [Salix viminalis]